MKNPHQVTRDFEAALCEYTGARYAVAVNSCTMALLLAVAWNVKRRHAHLREALKEPGGCRGVSDGRPAFVRDNGDLIGYADDPIEIPKRTYVGVPMAIIHAGGQPTFRDEDWIGSYQLKPLPVWDSARLFTSGMMDGTNPPGTMVCVSFHWSKTLGIQQGGAILHDDPEADEWLRMARFDGRREGVAPKDQRDWILGWHCYMSPEVAAEGLVRLAFLPKHNAPLPNDPYPDLSQLEIFR